MALIDKVVSWWGLQEASGTRVDEHGSNDLTDNNTVGQGTGHVQADCADFTTASSEWLSRASNSTLQFNDSALAIAGWFQVKDLTANYILVGKDDDAANSRDYTLDYDNVSGFFRFYTNGGGAANLRAIDTGTTVVANTWYFIVAQLIRFNPTSVGLFIRINNGTQFDNGGANITPNVSSAVFGIGAREYASFEGYLNGLAEQVVLFDESLDSGEETTLWNSGAGVDYADIAPGALTANVASATAIATGAATIAGTAATGGTGPYDYILQRGTDGSTYGTTVDTQNNVAGAPTPFADSGLTDGAQYFYRWNITDSVAAVVNSAGLPVVPHVAGSTFHVASGGNDSNNGLSTGAPWLTITRLNRYLYASRLANDSGVLNKGDTFSGNLVLPEVFAATKPSAGNRFTLGSYGTGARPILNAADGYGVDLSNVSFTEVTGLNLQGSGVDPDGTTTSTGSGINWELTGDDDLEETYVNDCVVQGFGLYGIVLHCHADSTGNWPDLTDSIQACTITECGIAGVAFKSSLVATEHDLRFTDAEVMTCSITLIPGDGTNSGYGIQFVNCDGGLAYANYIGECGAASGTGPGGPTGIITAECDGVIVRCCEVFEQHTNDPADGDGIDFDAGSRNCIGERNFVSNCDGAALMIWHAASPFTATANNIMRFNIGQNNGRRTLEAGVGNPATAISMPTGGTGSQWYNNTFYDTVTGSSDTESIYDTSTSGTVIRDNIFISTGAGRTLGVIAASTVLNPNRYYFFNSAVISGTDGGTPFANFAALQALGQEAGGSSGDPALNAIGTAGTAYPLGNFATLTEYDPTTSAIWDGGSNIQSYAGPDFHGNTMPTPVTGEYPLGAVGFAAAGARRRRALVTR